MGSDLARKHREVQREEDLRNLRVFVEKLVLGQLNVVFCANTRRWKKSCNLFASKHLVALEKVLGSWKNLANKILKGKGDTDAITKAVIVETINDEDIAIDQDDKKELIVESIEDQEIKEKDEEEQRLKKEKEEKEKEEIERKEEEERIRKEKEEKEEQERIE